MRNQRPPQPRNRREQDNRETPTSEGYTAGPMRLLDQRSNGRGERSKPRRSPCLNAQASLTIAAKAPKSMVITVINDKNCARSSA